MSTSFWPPVFAVSGTGIRSSLHSHHAWQLVLGLDGPALVKASTLAEPIPVHAVLIRPDVPHAADANGHEVVVAFVHPESEVAARLAARPSAGIEGIDAGAAERMRAALGSARAGTALSEGAARALAVLDTGTTRPRVRHRAVRKALRHLRSAAPGSDESLEALAALTELSPSRFMHVFSAEVGIPLRPYLRWLKLERATTALGAGASPAEAAHAAGFADAAHMTRSFREMLGTTPATLRRSMSVQAG